MYSIDYMVKYVKIIWIMVGIYEEIFCSWLNSCTIFILWDGDKECDFFFIIYSLNHFKTMKWLNWIDKWKELDMNSLKKLLLRSLWWSKIWEEPERSWEGTDGYELLNKLWKVILLKATSGC